MRIAIATDAWYPQPNGVVRVVGTVAERLRRRGHEILIISPDMFRTIPFPSYSEVRLAITPGRRTADALKSFRPDAIHIATEGPIGGAARRYCLANGLPFTTAYHSKFPEFIHARTRLPLSWLYERLRRFHEPSQAVMVPSSNVLRELESHGFGSLRLWSHGVDTDVFKPGAKTYLDDIGPERPLFMFIGRLAIDKNLPAFLDLDLPGSKAVVGSGPARDTLVEKYPDVTFRIADGDAELARYFNAGDVFVFPSLTDTFGLVMLEALACGVPVAAFPVTGPQDVLGSSRAGCLDTDLRRGALAALEIPSDICRAHAMTFTWDRVVDEFLEILAPIRQDATA